MGILDKINDAGEWVEDKVEEGVEWAGNTAEDGLRWSADVAEDLGSDGARDFLNDAATDVASATGAEVNELELGQTEDPKALIVGEPTTIREKSSKISDLGVSLSDTGAALGAISVANWQGEGAEEFQALWAKEPGIWDDAGSAFSDASSAMDILADEVEKAQDKAQTAIDKWRRAEEMEDKYNALSDEEKESSTLDVEAADLKREAQETLSDGRRARDSAVGVFQGEMDAAAAAAPEEPSFLDRMNANALDLDSMIEQNALSFVDGFVTAGSGTIAFVRSVNPADSYNRSHPYEYVSRMSDLGTGLVTVAADPGAAVDAMWQSIKEDPAKAAGGAAFDILTAVGTGGAGAGVKAVRGTKQLSDLADAARHAPDAKPAVSPKGNTPDSNSPDAPADSKSGAPGEDSGPAGHGDDGAPDAGDRKSPTPDHDSQAPSDVRPSDSGDTPSAGPDTRVHDDVADPTESSPRDGGGDTGTPAHPASSGQSPDGGGERSQPVSDGADGGSGLVDDQARPSSDGTHPADDGVDTSPRGDSGPEGRAEEPSSTSADGEGANGARSNESPGAAAHGDDAPNARDNDQATTPSERGDGSDTTSNREHESKPSPQHHETGDSGTSSPGADGGSRNDGGPPGHSQQPTPDSQHGNAPEHTDSGESSGRAGEANDRPVVNDARADTDGGGSPHADSDNSGSSPDHADNDRPGPITEGRSSDTGADDGIRDRTPEDVGSSGEKGASPERNDGSSAQNRDDDGVYAPADKTDSPEEDRSPRSDSSDGVRERGPDDSGFSGDKGSSSPERSDGSSTQSRGDDGVHAPSDRSDAPADRHGETEPRDRDRVDESSETDLVSRDREDGDQGRSTTSDGDRHGDQRGANPVPVAGHALASAANHAGDTPRARVSSANDGHKPAHEHRSSERDDDHGRDDRDPIAGNEKKDSAEDSHTPHREQSQEVREDNTRQDRRGPAEIRASKHLPSDAVTPRMEKTLDKAQRELDKGHLNHRDRLPGEDSSLKHSAEGKESERSAGTESAPESRGQDKLSPRFEKQYEKEAQRYNALNPDSPITTKLSDLVEPSRSADVHRGQNSDPVRFDDNFDKAIDGLTRDSFMEKIRDLGSNLSGRFGEWMTQVHLESRGYEILGENFRIQLPDGKVYRPDFLAYDPVSERVFAVDSKFGPKAKLLPNQLDGYTRMTKGEDLNILDKEVRIELDARYLPHRVDDVEIYRWKDLHLSSELIEETIARIVREGAGKRGMDGKLAELFSN